MRYFVRQRGKDDVLGPFSPQDIVARVRTGQLARWDMILADTGQTAEQLRNHRDFKWEPLASVLPAAGQAQLVRPAQAPRQMLNAVRAAANRMMLHGALWCAGGIAVTAVSYSMAIESPAGGTYVVAYGAIIFGFIQFLRGLSAR